MSSQESASLRGPLGQLKVMRTPVLDEKPAALLQSRSSASLPSRVAVIGNHLPRQCGIATFTTDLCDAVAVEYGASAALVVAVNDPQSRYSYPARVRFEITAGTNHRLRAMRTRHLEPLGRAGGDASQAAGAGQGRADASP